MPQSAQGGYLCQRQQPGPSLPPEGEQLGVGLSEKHRHISNLVFRADSMPSFQIQTALKIMLARHRVPITTHLRPIIRQRQLWLVRGSAAHQQSGKWIPRMPGPQGDAAAGPQSPPPPGGWGGRTLQLNGRLGAPTASATQNSIGIFSLLFRTGTRFTMTVHEAALQPDGDGTWTAACPRKGAWAARRQAASPGSPPPGSIQHGTGSRVRSRQRQQSGPWLWRKGDNHVTRWQMLV